MKAIVKVQQTKSNTFVNIPATIREVFELKKGESLEIKTDGSDKLIIKKV